MADRVRSMLWLLAVVGDVILSHSSVCRAQDAPSPLSPIHPDKVISFQHNPARSPYFDGLIGATVPSNRFPAENYLIDKSRYDYEGNWAFCVFDGEEIPAARFGFGGGAFDVRDYGPGDPPSKDFLLLQLEMMTRDGAVLWLANGKYKASQIRTAPKEMEVWLDDDGKRIFYISGWPNMRWRFASDDGEAELDMHITPKMVTILPDQLLPRNRFAMWLSVGQAEGTFRFRQKSVSIKGTAFYDHPRTCLQSHDVAPVGWYLYMPIAFEDGSRLAAYHTVDGHGKPDESFCFGLFITPDGRAQWLLGGVMRRMAMDQYQFPASWTTQWKTPAMSLTIDATVRDAKILKTWGGSGWCGGAVPKTRAENRNLPLVFDCSAKIVQQGHERTIKGKGVAEYVKNAAPAKGP